MKNTILSLTAFSAISLSLFADDAKTYVLAKKDYVPPVGSVLETDESMNLKEGKMQMNLQGQPMDGVMSITESATEKVEVLAADKLRYTLIKSANQQKMVMMGQAMPAENKAKAIVGKAIILTRKDGKWSGALEEGKATAEETLEIKGVVEKNNNRSDFKIYGDAPRKVGDEWEVDGSDLMGFDELEGKVKVKFVKVEKLNGTDCAVLDCSFEVKGYPEEVQGAEMGVSGKVMVHRSLKDMIDVSTKFNGTMAMNGNMEPQPGMKIGMKMKGAMVMQSSTKVTRP